MSSRRLLLILTFLFIAPRTTLAGEAIKIGFVLSTFQEERYEKDKKYFAEEAKRLGFEPVILSAENNPQTQRTKVENLLAMGVGAIVLQAVNSQAAANLVKLAHERKIPFIAYDRMIAEAPVDFYVTQDSFKVGVLQAEAAVKATKGKGKYVILQGQAGHSVANEITRGVKSVLAKYPGVKIVSDKPHDGWSSALATATIATVLTQHDDKIAAILANNSGMAHGAVQALSERDLLGQVFVAGADADLRSIKHILAGAQQFEVLKDISPLARTSADVAFQLAKGKKPNVTSTIKSGPYTIPMIATPVYAIDKSNIEEKIFKSGFHSRDAVLDKTK